MHQSGQRSGHGRRLDRHRRQHLRQRQHRHLEHRRRHLRSYHSQRNLYRLAWPDCDRRRAGNVEIPPPPPPQASKLSECDFPNKIKPWRVDNTCKAMLDDVAKNLQQDPDTKLVVVGNADPTEKRKNLAGERAVNVKAYLTRAAKPSRASTPSRIETRTGNAGTKTS